MVQLANEKRQEYEPQAPVFHCPVANASDVHRPWLTQLVGNHEVGAFMHEDAEGDVDGFVVVTTLPAPPVYDPGGLSALIDDFAVSPSHRWATAGVALLAEAMAWAREHGAVQVVVVSGPHDQPKRAALHEAGLFVASEWFTKPLT